MKSLHMFDECYNQGLEDAAQIAEDAWLTHQEIKSYPDVVTFEELCGYIATQIRSFKQK